MGQYPDDAKLKQHERHYVCYSLTDQTNKEALQTVQSPSVDTFPLAVRKLLAFRRASWINFTRAAGGMIS